MHSENTVSLRGFLKQRDADMRRVIPTTAPSVRGNNEQSMAHSVFYTVNYMRRIQSGKVFCFPGTADTIHNFSFINAIEAGERLHS